MLVCLLFLRKQLKSTVSKTGWVHVCECSQLYSYNTMAFWTQMQSAETKLHCTQLHQGAIELLSACNNLS